MTVPAVAVTMALHASLVLAAPPPDAAGAAAGAPELVLNVSHVGEITAVAVSPDSRTIASGSRDRTVKLWDAATGKLQRTLTGHRDVALSVAFAADGATVYSGSRDGTARGWDVRTGRLAGTFAGRDPLPEKSSVTAIAACPIKSTGGTKVLLLARALWPENSIQLWRAGEVAEPIPSLIGHLKRVSALAFSPDGKLLASGSADGMVKLWDAEDGTLQRSLKGYAMPVTALSFSADSRLLLTGSDDGIAKVWDVASGKEQQELQMNRPGDGVGAVAIAPDNGTVVTGGHGGSRGRDFLKLWDRATGSETAALSGHETYVTAVAFSPDGRYFVSGSRDTTLRIWDRPAAGGPAPRAVGSSESVSSVAYDPHGALLAGAGADGAVRLWNASTGSLLRALAAHTGRVGAVAFSPDGKSLASGGNNKAVRLWNPETGEPGPALLGATGPINALAFSPDGTTLAAGVGTNVDDSAVILWDLRAGTLRQRLSGESLGMVRAVAFSPDGTLIASGSSAWGGGELRLWDAATGKQLLKTYSGAVRAVAFSPDGKQLAAGSVTTNEEGEPTGEEIRLYNARTREAQRTLTVPEEGGATCALVFADNGVLVSGGRGGAIRIWNTRTGEITQTLTGHVGSVLSLTRLSPVPGAGAAAPTPPLVASGGLDNTVRLWRVGGGVSKLLATLVTTPAAEAGAKLADSWIALAPEGFYDSAPGAERLIAWRVGGSLFPVEAYEGTFHRPELLRRALRGEVLPETGEVEQFRRGASVPPQIQFRTPRDGQSISGAKKLRVELTVTDESRVTRVELFANGRPLNSKPLEVGAKPLQVGAKPLEVGAKPLEVGAKPLEVGAKPLEVGAKPLEVGAKPLEVGAKPIPVSHRLLQQFQVEVPLPAGDPQITLSALAYNQKSLQAREEVRVTRGGGLSPAPPVSARGVLYVLAAGVSQYRNAKYNLKYASRDAGAFSNLWARPAASGALYKSVSVTRLTDAETTAPRLQAALFRILENATENDTVALFLSGHGVQAGAGDYYFATHEIDAATPARIAETALPWRVLQTTLAAVKARRVLLFLDACHSGNALGSQQAENERMAELLVKRAGVMVFASSRGSEYSYELDETKHGAFTAALVEGIAEGKADLQIGGRRDGIVTAEELLVYLRTRVPQLTRNRQTPSCPLLRDFGDAFPISSSGP